MRPQILRALTAACSFIPSLPFVVSAQTPSLSAVVLAKQVEVRRTTHGVPHIKADNLAAAGYAEAYVQSEDYGPRVALSLLRARGEMALVRTRQHQ
jgi:Protein related to penicillin acylase